MAASEFRKFHWKTSMLESPFNKAAVLRACNLIKKRLQHGCFPMKFAKILNIYVEEHLRTAASKFIHYTHVLLSLDVITYYIS